MNVSIRQQTDEVELSTMLLGEAYSAFPGIALVDGTGFDALVNQLGTLGLDLSAA